MVYKALILEDNATDASLMEQYLHRSAFDFEVKWVDSGDVYEETIGTFEPDVIISDYRLKQYTGLDAIRYKNLKHEGVPLVIVSGTIGEEKAVELVKEGATDFLIKNNAASRLGQVVERAIKEAMEREKRKRAEFKLKSSEERFRMLFEHSLDGIIIGNPKGKGKVITANAAACKMLGYNLSELKNMSLGEFIGIKEMINKGIEKRDQKGYFRGELDMRRKDGSLLPVEVSSRILKLKDGEQRSYYIIRDISDRKRAEQEIQNSLREKETLLMEIHHRVKNNLAVVSGMMEMQAMESDSEELRTKLLDSQSRIKSIALTHELLYQERSFSNVDFNANIKKLVKSIAETANSNVVFNYDLDTVRLNINQALPCSLIINELITNALKHAFTDKKSSVVNITLKKNENIISLSINDNGVGLPEDFVLEEVKTTGFTLIKILADQLKGQMNIGTDKGTRVHLQFTKAEIKGTGSSILDSS